LERGKFNIYDYFQWLGLIIQVGAKKRISREKVPRGRKPVRRGQIRAIRLGFALDRKRAVVVGTGADQNRTNALLRKSCEGRFEIGARL
jgi:hypothetical protein